MRACVCASVRVCLVYVFEREYAWVISHTGVCACPLVLVCVRVRAVGGNTSVVRDVLTLTLTLTPRVCVCPAARAEHGRQSDGFHHYIRQGRGRRGARPRDVRVLIARGGG